MRPITPPILLEFTWTAPHDGTHAATVGSWHIGHVAKPAPWASWRAYWHGRALGPFDSLDLAKAAVEAAHRKAVGP